MSHSIAVVVAAGKGLRAGRETPKQFVPLGGQALLRWSVNALSNHPRVSRTLVAVNVDFMELARELTAQFPNVEIICGGAERTDTVRAALAVLADGPPPETVLIHDAARPGVSTRVIDDLFDALDTHKAAAPALKLVDAVKRAPNDATMESVDRTDLYRVQTPQAFRFQTLLNAYQITQSTAVDDLSLVQAAGVTPHLIPGERRLMKITHAEDFAMAERLLAPETAAFRIGSGYDVHAFEEGDAITLCGVAIPYSRKLKGHSDADVGWHALTDAVLGALAAGDIGDHFPPSDPKWKGAPSSTFLAHARDLALQKGFAIANIDVTLICEAPKISPHRDAMRRATAALLGVALETVSIKATTTEKLGFLGRGEGVAAQASALLVAAPVNAGDA